MNITITSGMPAKLDARKRKISSANAAIKKTGFLEAT